jgi:hypothetical protein
MPGPAGEKPLPAGEPPFCGEEKPPFNGDVPEFEEGVPFVIGRGSPEPVPEGAPKKGVPLFDAAGEVDPGRGGVRAGEDPVLTGPPPPEPPRHCPLRQDCANPHTAPHAPQFIMSLDRSWHICEHIVCPWGQAHAPSVQCAPPEQT